MFKTSLVELIFSIGKCICFGVGLSGNPVCWIFIYLGKCILRVGWLTCFNPFLFRKMHAWVWDDQAILLLKTLIPRKGELLKQSASASRLGKNYILLPICNQIHILLKIINCYTQKKYVLHFPFLFLSFSYPYLCTYICSFKSIGKQFSCRAWREEWGKIKQDT